MPISDAAQNPFEGDFAVTERRLRVARLADSLRRVGIADKIYKTVLSVAAVSVLVIIAGLIFELVMGSRQSFSAFGLHFFADSTWDPNANKFGALPFILGTLYSSFWALVIALPISIFTAIFLSEIAPRWLERPTG